MSIESGRVFTRMMTWVMGSTRTALGVRVATFILWTALAASGGVLFERCVLAPHSTGSAAILNSESASSVVVPATWVSEDQRLLLLDGQVMLEFAIIYSGIGWARVVPVVQGEVRERVTASPEEPASFEYLGESYLIYVLDERASATGESEIQVAVSHVVRSAIDSPR